MTDPKQELIGAIDGDALAKKLREELAFPIEADDEKFGQGVNSVCKSILDSLEAGAYAFPSPDTSRDLTPELQRKIMDGNWAERLTYLRKAHFIDLLVRIDGKTKLFEGDWIKEALGHLLDAKCAEVNRAADKGEK